MKVESPNEISEDILFIHQTLLGNQVAFEKLVIKYRPMIFTLVASYVKNSADAEDLTQEVFLKAYQNLSSLKNHGQFSFWLKQIARNHCTDWLRQQRENHLSFDEIKVAETTKMASPISSGFTTSPEEIALRQELREIVWQAIDSLLEIDRRLIEARYLENASLKQLQADYGLSYSAIAGRLKRAKQKVRETVQKMLGGFCALPGREILEKIFLGGIEAVKLSLKTKLVTVGVAVMLGLGGAGVWHWHSKPAPQKTTVVHQQEMKATSATATPKVVIEKPALKVAQQAQPEKSPVQTENKQEGFSEEEWAELEQWLAETEQIGQQGEAGKQGKTEEKTGQKPSLEERRKAALAQHDYWIAQWKANSERRGQLMEEYHQFDKKLRDGRDYSELSQEESQLLQARREEMEKAVEELNQYWESVIHENIKKVREIFLELGLEIPSGSIE